MGLLNNSFSSLEEAGLSMIKGETAEFQKRLASLLPADDDGADAPMPALVGHAAPSHGSVAASSGAAPPVVPAPEAVIVVLFLLHPRPRTRC